MGQIGVQYDSYKQYSRPYSAASLRRLSVLAAAMKEGELSIWKRSDPGPAGCVLTVIREGENAGFARLISRLRSCNVESLLKASNAEYLRVVPEVAFMRRFAEERTVAFGHVSPYYSSGLGETELERALIRHPWDTVPRCECELRGYAWVTVISSQIAVRLGGAGALARSGVFAAAEEVLGGAVWLQMTGRWDEYAPGAPVIGQVFEVLARFLPAGMPRPAGQVMIRGRYVEVPYRLSLRDAAGYRDGEEGA